MTIHYGNKGVIFEDSYEYKEQIKKVGGRWVPHLGIWYVKTVCPSETIKAFFGRISKNAARDTRVNYGGLELTGEMARLVLDESLPPVSKEWWK